MQKGKVIKQARFKSNKTMAVIVKKRWNASCGHQPTGDEARHKGGIYAGLMGGDKYGSALLPP